MSLYIFITSATRYTGHYTEVLLMLLVFTLFTNNIKNLLIFR